MIHLNGTSNSNRTMLVLLGIAILVALLHMIPFWHAQAQTPPGYVFSGNLSNSPDLMQYRVLVKASHGIGSAGFG